ncbi:MAG: tyrosine-type recombinase/integrase [Deltaproteobacteria bacterium]|nr:tyrosine-type recombinase/integrase [Deltaproteobacteria bacterium]
MFVHQRKHGRWIARFPKGTLPDDPCPTRQYFGRGIETETAARLFNDSLPLFKHAPKHLKRFLITWRGKPVKRIVGAFKRAKRKAKIDPNRKLPPYAFCHAFVTAALNAGGDLKGVSEMAGHSRTETKTRIYQHTNINLHRGIIENLPPIAVDS